MCKWLRVYLTTEQMDKIILASETTGIRLKDYLKAIEERAIWADDDALLLEKAVNNAVYAVIEDFAGINDVPDDEPENPDEPPIYDDEDDENY